MADVALLVNCTDQGMTGKPALDVDLARLAGHAWSRDLIYTPLETPFLAQARMRGCVTVNGLGLLLNQARLGFKAWFGVLPDVTPELLRGHRGDLLNLEAKGSDANVDIRRAARSTAIIHVIDPVRFPYAADTPYRPSGQEIAPAAHLLRVLDVFDVAHALVVGTNSGYGADSRILLDALELGTAASRASPWSRTTSSIGELERLKAAASSASPSICRFTAPTITAPPRLFCEKLVDLGPVSADPGRTAINCWPAAADRDVAGPPGDRSLRPASGRAGLQPAGVPGAARELGRARDASVKLSGYYKFSQQPYPHDDAWPFIAALVEAFTLDRCVWGSDWPFLRAPERLDYGPAACHLGRLFPDRTDQQRLLWRTPARLLGFQPNAEIQANRKTQPGKNDMRTFGGLALRCVARVVGPPRRKRNRRSTSPTSSNCPGRARCPAPTGATAPALRSTRSTRRAAILGRKIDTEHLDTQSNPGISRAQIQKVLDAIPMSCWGRSIPARSRSTWR